MVIHGKERGLLLTVGASVGIAELCPNGDMSRLGEVLSAENAYGDQVKTISKIIIEMNRGFEMSKKFSEPDYIPEIITEEELLALPPKVFGEFQKEALAAFKGDTKTTVEVEPSKKNEDVAPL